MAQTPCIKVSAGEIIPDPSTTTRTGGDVVVVGTIPLVCQPTDPNQIGANALDTMGLHDVPKDTSTFTAGDAVYWNTTANPVLGTAGTGAATSTASGANLMGFAQADAATGANYVRTKLSAAKRTATIAGSVTADDITGSDSSLGITGNAPATTSSAGGSVVVAGGIGGSVSGAGGAVSMIAGVGTTNAAGGTGTFSGGAGAGTGAGGAVTSKGGASGAGATGNGGAYTAGGGAAASTNGTGGAASLTGGLATGTGVGGAVNITSGASGGASGTAGAIAIDTGSAAGGTAGAITIGGSNAGSITLGKMPRIPTGTVAAAGSVQGDAGALIEGFNLVSAADGTKGVVLPSAVAGMQVLVKCNANAVLKVWPASGDAINAIAANSAMSLASGFTSALFTAYDATTWYTLPLLPS